mmetsp:Transcript_13923/g.16773  ORF Transcript_13923/g.16773 Transcript_13923/m.16773 type:complete len:255 (-) Transcript_13923:355-1119(-)
MAAMLRVPPSMQPVLPLEPRPAPNTVMLTPLVAAASSGITACTSTESRYVYWTLSAVYAAPPTPTSTSTDARACAGTTHSTTSELIHLALTGATVPILHTVTSEATYLLPLTFTTVLPSVGPLAGSRCCTDINSTKLICRALLLTSVGLLPTSKVTMPPSCLGDSHVTSADDTNLASVATSPNTHGLSVSSNHIPVNDTGKPIVDHAACGVIPLITMLSLYSNSTLLLLLLCSRVVAISRDTNPAELAGMEHNS